MGFFEAIGKLLSGGEISFEKRTHLSTAENLLTADKQIYIGEWRGQNTSLLIRADGTIDYRREETVGDTTNTDTVTGPINAFQGASFTVGILGQNKRFEIEAPPTGDAITVNGERLARV